MKNNNFVFSNPSQRATAYVVVFAVGSALFTLFRPMPYGSIVPGLILIVAFVLVGAFLIHNRNLLSRITSGATLFALSGMAIGLSGPIPSSYTLLLALIVSWLGARPFLHRQNSLARTLLYSVYVVIIAIALTIALTAIERLLWNQINASYLKDTSYSQTAPFA